jgi:hypothetical protein
MTAEVIWGTELGMLKRICAALVLGILGVAASIQLAAADPIGAKNSFSFPVTCDNGQSVEVVVNGNGRFNAAHVVGSTAAFVPEALDVTFEFTPTGGTTETETSTESKNNLHGDVVTCSFDVTQTAPGGTLRLFGTATGFFTPAS